ncbi:pyruvate carboxylase [Kiritimatiellota bacterium B12222]|nr:pyruvate carboxylase [Kiritimatiellota bacterium B12222]
MQIKKLLVANRSEIAIRVFRSAHELGIRTVAMYSHEDRFSLHRFKADEAYQIGEAGEPIRNYLSIEKIITLAKERQVDAIHPGYGFLSENADFARRCRDEGILFIGPSPEMLDELGDKTAARNLAGRAGVPILSGSKKAVRSGKDALTQAEKLGFPVILKASMGGGGRGMRVVRAASELEHALEQAQSEALSAFGCADVFIEKFIERARHIEVQLLGDTHGNLVHLYERDCSVQRRHQKVVEIAPSPNLDPDLRKAICDAGVAIGREVNYSCAGTVEFLVDADTQEFYFIEVNPRIQVEHTVTEEVTGVDLVKRQILVTQGAKLSDEEIGLADQSKVHLHGFAIQCRVTTEDPANNFLPDYGKISHYRSSGGMGIRLDAGSAFSGAVVTPYFDSLLVKVTSRGTRFTDAVNRMERALAEFRIRGVKSNIPFLTQLIAHPTFLEGSCTTRFIDKTPELFEMRLRRDRANRMLLFLGDLMVNGNSLVEGRPEAHRRDPATLPSYQHEAPYPEGTRDVFKRLGGDAFSEWLVNEQRLLITDTSFRDAQQSLLATRMRTKDMADIAEAYARLCPQLFSLEMWGGATFDTSMRFLKEDPWERLARIREKAPNMLLQMLLRASSAVGYSNYPDNVVRNFVREAAGAGLDVFRIFDALNYLPNMKVAMEAARKHDAICEACICYTGDILDPTRQKYNLEYYLHLARELKKMGAHILCIKDMAGLLKPEAAKVLVKALKEEVGLPVHLHTHDTSGIQAASILNAADMQLDIADAAMAPLSGGTSQPNLNTLVETLRFGKRNTELNPDHLDVLAEYWRNVREFYTAFESETLPATADLYRHEMPGGQYTNLYQQARALGLANRWPDVCKTYADVNQLFGDIVKVTPTSKAVGDMALFLVANDLKATDTLDPNRELAFPASVKDLVSGRMGKPHGGFPKGVVTRILRGDKPMRGRAGSTLPAVDFTAAKAEVRQLINTEPTEQQVLSYVLYPKVYTDFAKHRTEYGDTSVLPTPVFLHGMRQGEEIAIDIEAGKTLIIKYVSTSEPHENGTRTVFFELNGIPRSVDVRDKTLDDGSAHRAKANASDATHIGSSMPGMVVAVTVIEGENVTKGQKLMVLEAMKMETTVYAEKEGKVEQVLIKPGTQVETGDLMMVIA